LRRLRARVPDRLHHRREGVGRGRYNRGVPGPGWQRVPAPGSAPSGKPLTVTELNGCVQRLLEREFAEVRVEGALSRIVHAASGHLYFALQDATSRIDGIMFASAARMLPFTPAEGLQVRVGGRVTLYGPTGKYQINVMRMEPAGLGAREALLRALRAKLKSEGVLDPSRKRALPRFPKCIALVTSPDGAAVHDMLKVILGRFGRAHLVLVPVRVQGEGSAAEIADGIRRAGMWPGVEVIITGRGGGSVEDLWAFNEEAVARALFASPVPVISAVGHETDVTLADEVADVRAATPSNAGEIVVPVLADVERDLASALERGRWAIARIAQRARAAVDACAPSRGGAALPRRLEAEKRRLAEAGRRLREALLARIRSAQHGLALGTRVLQALNPTAVLGRGFSLTWTEDGGARRLVRDGSQIAPGAVIRTTLAKGADLVSEVRKPVDRALGEG
jgi:exodeoxyribonuclease VII large subunit